MRLTLDQSWELCIEMWTWIVEEWNPNEGRNVNFLKKEYLNLNGFDENNIDSNCFFCEYDNQRDQNCSFCPPAEIDKDFNCSDDDYEYDSKPVEFLAKIKALNRIRLKRKK